MSVSDERPPGDDWPSAIPLAGALDLEELLRTELPELAEPVMIGPYEGFQRIGRGGFGVVYRARDLRLGRDVAVKLCSNLEPDVVEAFRREAKILAMFSHPNIVTVYDVGWHGKDFFYAMELIEGCDGAHYISREPDWREALDVYIPAATGLAAAHAKGIVHGDFKPANVLIGDDGRVRVADFGLAQSIGKADRNGDGGPGAGTLPYMAPELHMGQRPSTSSDQWALCAALWETIFRCRPFFGKTPAALLSVMLSDKPRVPWCAPSVPDALLEVLRKGLSVAAGDRFPSMSALIEALAEIRSPMLALQMPATSTPSARPWLPFVQGVAWSLVLGGGLVLAALGWLDQPGVEPSDDGRPSPLAATEPPCALGDESSEVLDPTVVSMCQFIRAGHFRPAYEAWTDEHLKRSSAGKAELGEQTLIIARTFVEQAEAIQETKPEEAAAAAGYARMCVERAAVRLGETDAVGDVRERAEVFDARGSTTSD